MIILMTLRRKIATLLVTASLTLAGGLSAQILEYGPALPPYDETFSVMEGGSSTSTVEPLSTREQLAQQSNFDLDGPNFDNPYRQGTNPDSPGAEMPDGLEVLTRGPLHEAFATAHQSNPEPSPIVAAAPPQLIDEVPPEYKPEGANVQWIPGYWAWDDAASGFIWISGVWRDVPPQRRWVPGYWDQADDGSKVGHRWVSGFWAEEAQQELGYLPQPPATIDQGPSVAPPTEEHFYVPGNWDFHDDRYRWLSGHWHPTTQNRVWIPARYVWTPTGCVFVSGYWDYDIEYRGTCFAPVQFERPVYLADNYQYRPSFAINLDIDFLTHLFVRPRCGHYYYGDWYANSFVSLGYRPWVDYRSHHRSYDPLLSYYRSRRSSFDRRFNVVQYLGQQHQFYARHHDYRPRPTFVAQFNFQTKNRGHQHRSYINKSNYVKAYSQLRKSSDRNIHQHQRDLVRNANRLQQDLNRKQRQFRKIEKAELLASKKRIENINRLKRDRKKSEIRLTSLNVDVKTGTKNRTKNQIQSFKPPIRNSNNNQVRNQQANRSAQERQREQQRQQRQRNADRAARQQANQRAQQQRQRDQENEKRARERRAQNQQQTAQRENDRRARQQQSQRDAARRERARSQRDPARQERDRSQRDAARQ